MSNWAREGIVRVHAATRNSAIPSGVDNMPEFKLPDSVNLFSQEKTAIANLWTVYVAATFAAAGYGFSAERLTLATATALTLGYSAFALGHWSLLEQSLTISSRLKGDIRSAIAGDSEKPFKSSIEALVNRANPVWVSRTIHLVIDACVIVIIWARIFGT
jgi:hypothetical protein